MEFCNLWKQLQRVKKKICQSCKKPENSVVLTWTFQKGCILLCIITSLVRLRGHPTPVWMLFLDPFQPEWILPPRGRHKLFIVSITLDLSDSCISIGNAVIKSCYSSVMLTENLSRVFGPATMRGLRKLRIICRRSRWKYCAGVVGLTTPMLTLSPSTPSSLLSHIWGMTTWQDPKRHRYITLQNVFQFSSEATIRTDTLDLHIAGNVIVQLTCRKRSIRHEECSGPAPS